MKRHNKYIFLFLIFFLSSLSFSQNNTQIALLPDSNILVCGGNYSDANLNNDCFIHFPQTKGYSIGISSFQYSDALSVPRSSHTMTLLPDGRVLVSGGYDSGGAANLTADVLTINYQNPLSTPTITRTTVDMLTRRAEHTATLLTQGPDAGNLLICGGKDNSGNSLNSCEIFITSSTQFKLGPTMNSSRNGHSANLLPNGKVFLAGGYSTTANDYMLTTDLYDPNNNSMAPGPSLLSGRAYHTATTLPNGFTVLIGGFNGYNNLDIFSKDNTLTQIQQNQGTHGFVDVMEIFDQSGARAPTGNIPLPIRSAYHNSTLMTDGSIFMDSGFGNIAPTYFRPSIIVSTPSTVNFTNPQVLVSTGNRLINIAAGSNILLPLNVQLSRQVMGRVVDGDLFMPPNSQGMPTISIRNVDIYFKKTTAQLDTFRVTGDDKKGYGWFEKETTVLTLYNPHQSIGSYAVFKPLSLMTDITTGGNFYLRLEGGGNLSSGTIRNITNSTGTIGLNFPISDMYNGANITGTVTLKSLHFSNAFVSVQLNNGFAPINASVVNGRVNTSVDLTGIEGVITNTTDHTIIFPYDVSSSLLAISFDLSFTANSITINQEATFNIDPSTIVIRRMIFSNYSLYYPKKNEFYLNPSGKLQILYFPTFNHSTTITRNGTLFRIGGQNCENTPFNCNRTTPIMTPTTNRFYLALYPTTQWNDLKKLNNKRAFHTATVLNDGNILVCGGTDGIRTYNTCELYDRKLEDWVLVATMSVSRSYHTATLLPNGTVLIAGGTSGKTKEDAALRHCDIYYPDVKKIVKTADMTLSRLLHTATLLPNGNVLVLGGANSGSYLGEGEIFISTANIWLPLSTTMAKIRSEHTATLLKNNRVLITGGVNGTENAINNCELFDISNRTFSNTSPMAHKRKGHTATILDDGNVVVIGGSNGSYVVSEYEIYNPDTTSWTALTVPKVFDKPNDSENDVYIPRANHNAIVLPNNDIVLVGGESINTNELVRSLVEYYNNHMILPLNHGTTNRRIGSKTILAQDNKIVTIGGFDGANNYLDSVQRIYYTGYLPDQENLEPLIPRKPIISSSTLRADNGEFITFTSTYSNLHSITEAGGGGAAGRNSDFYKPQILLRSLNENFMINLSTMLYNRTVNSNWNTTLSTITINIPPQISSAPYGWYYLYNCVNNICSDPYIIQISTPRPTCDIINLAAAESLSTTSIRWNWSLNSVNNANGFAVFSASNVFITTVSFPSPLSAPATYYQLDLLPNTPSAIKVGCYNIGGFSDPSTYAVALSTVYTKANPPKNLTITYASFDTVDLSWDGSGNNPDYTPYQLEISTYSDFSEYAIMMSFVNNYKQTNLTIRNLEPNWRYYFRVKARNGNGVETVYDTQNSLSTSTFNNPVSTITVGNIIGLDGTPMSPTSIKWSWNRSGGATGYEIYEYKVSTNFYTKELEDVSVFLSSTSYNYYTQVNLSTNTSYVVKVRSYKQDAATFNQLIYGPFSISQGVYTLAAVPAPSNNVFTQITTGSFKVNWDANGNTDVTRYRLDISNTPNFVTYTSYEVKTDSTTFPYIYEYASGLKPNYKYYTRVYAINESNKLTDNAANLGYKYTLAQPVTRVYVTSVSLSGVTVNWDPKENSPDTIYQVRATSVSFESPFVSTPVPFGKEFKGTSYMVNGLWINTTYYFDVTARNVEGNTTSSIQTTTPAVTLAGPGGAPPSAIAGITDPNSDTEISGILIDNRPVVLRVPKESFTAPQPLAVAKLNSNPCGYTFGGSTITFGIYANAQPYVPVKFTFDYFGDEAINATKPPDINTNKSKIALARYNPDTGQCLPVKTVIDSGLRKITADLNHFSLYQLILLNPSSNLNNIKVFPNPFYPNRPGQGMITITNLPENSYIKIYTLSGQKVFETKSDTTGTAYWEGLNLKGQMVGSGVYLCHIKSRYGSKTIKIAVER